MRSLPLARPDQDQASNALSFDDVYRLHARRVAGWIARLGGPHVDVDEGLQEVFLTVNRRLPEFRGEAKLTTWLFRVTTRVVANHRRASRRRGLWARLTERLLNTAPSNQPTPSDALEERQAGERFYRVLDELPEHFRQVLVLFELDEMTTDDIARTLDRPPATVRVWLHRARAEFTKRWQARREQEESS